MGRGEMEDASATRVQVASNAFLPVASFYASTSSPVKLNFSTVPFALLTKIKSAYSARLVIVVDAKIDVTIAICLEKMNCKIGACLNPMPALRLAPLPTTSATAQ